MSAVSANATPSPFSFAGFPLESWAFAVRIWIAAMLALLASFWLQLDSASSAMITVMILAEPTRGQALEKAGYRAIATVIGVAASLAIVGTLAQARDLLLAGFAAWLGLCVYASKLFDGNRAYAAILAGYTVAFIAVQQIDSPGHVFETGMARGAAIAVGVLSITLVNDLLLAPDHHPRLALRLAALHRRLRGYAAAVIRGEATDPVAATALLQDIVALRPDISSLAAESSSGPVRSTAARSTMVALVAELQAVRALAALPAISAPALREQLASMFDRDELPGASGADQIAGKDLPDGATIWALRELMRHDTEVHGDLSALKSLTYPTVAWRAPLYRSQRIAIENGARAAVYFALASVLLVWGGWTSASFSLSLVAVLVGLGATTPSPRVFTTLAFIGTPIAAGLAGVLEFFVLDGVSDFPLLAIGFAPFVIGPALLMTRSNPVLVGLGRINLIFIPAVIAASNPQTYDPQTFIFSALFLWIATGLLLAAQFLIPPVSDDQRRRWLLASARRELDLVLCRSDRRYAPEEATFRDAVRVGNTATAGAAGAQPRACAAEALAYFDQAAAIRFSGARLAKLARGPSAKAAAQARAALIARDPQLIRAAAASLGTSAEAGDSAVAETRAALLTASAVIEQACALTARIEGSQS